MDSKILKLIYVILEEILWRLAYWSCDLNQN